MNEDMQLVVIQKEKGFKRFLIPILTAVVGIGIGAVGAEMLATPAEEVKPQQKQKKERKQTEDKFVPNGQELLIQLRDQDRDSNLTSSIKNGNLRTFLKHIANKELINKANEAGNTPLHLAAAYNRDDMVYVLLQVGADPLLQNKNGRLPSDLARNAATRRACLYGEELRKLELALFDDLNLGRNKSKTIEDDIRKALELGINPNAFTGDNKLPLLSKILYSGCSAELAKTLLDAGAAPDLRHRHDGGTPLYAAIAVGKLDVAKMLIKAGANPVDRKFNGASPLHDAIWLNRKEAVKLLAPYYKSCNYSPAGNTVGYAPSMIIHEGYSELFRILIDAGMNVNHSMFADSPLLSQAVAKNRPEIVDMLLQAGADKNARDKNGKRAIDYAKDEAMAKKLR